MKGFDNEVGLWSGGVKNGVVMRLLGGCRGLENSWATYIHI